MLELFWRCNAFWYVNKGNNKITELRTIFRRESQNSISIKTDKISQQPENCENRNDPDLVQESIYKNISNQEIRW
jgi:hypothetical protein